MSDSEYIPPFQEISFNTLNYPYARLERNYVKIAEIEAENCLAKITDQC